MIDLIAPRFVLSHSGVDFHRDKLSPFHSSQLG
jgi:hypothetical protein